ncbi:MAG: hypothetical protein AMXMBFR83_07490 [Phycisphaerae bacterium]
MSGSWPWIIDGHLDLSLGYRRNRRELTWPLERIRSSAGEPHPRGGTATVSLPEMRRGGVGMAFATVLALTRPPDHPEPLEPCEAKTPRQAHDTALGDLAYYRGLAAGGHARLLGDRAGLEAHVADWQAGRPERTLGLVPLMEGAEPILAPGEAGWWYEQGVRIVSLAWFGTNRYAHGTGTPGGLTVLGRELLREMRGTRLILDVSHLAEQACHEALDGWDGPVIASHSNAAALVPGDRQLGDEAIRRLAERDGVIGVALHGGMLSAGWRRGDTGAGVSLSTAADHIDYICQLVGNARHVAVGSDLDGGFGREQCPRELDSIADLGRLFGLLAGRGYDQAAIAGVAHDNWLRVLRRAW